MSSTKKKGSANKGADLTPVAFSKKGTSSVMAAGSDKASPEKAAMSTPFRFRWQKRGSYEYQDTLIKSNKANSSEEKNSGAITNESESVIDDDFDDEHIKSSPAGKTTLQKANDTDEDSDMEFKEEESDGDGEYQSASGKPAARKTQKYNQKKGLKPSGNGRVVGRKLVMWHRPRMVEKLMLHLQYECHRAGLRLPWDKAVQRLSAGSSGASALQHLNKLRDILITEGHMVPPLLGKFTVPQNPHIRGYIRDLDAKLPTETRIVNWEEHVEDLKLSLEVDGVVRGSGNYRRGTDKSIEKGQKATGSKKIKKRNASAMSSRAESLDPAEMDSAEEYDPSTARRNTKYGRRKTAKPKGKYKLDDSDDDRENDANDESPSTRAIRQIVKTTMTTPQTKRLKGNDKVNGLVTPPSNKCVVLHLRPELLKTFPPSTGLKNEVTQEQDDLFHQHDDEMGQGAAEDYESDVNEAAYNSEDDHIAFPQTPLAQQMALHSGYQGTGIHGLKAHYDEAVLNGRDPTENGFLNSNHLQRPQSSVTGRISSAYRHNAPPPAYSQIPHTLPRQSRQTHPMGTPTSAFSTFGANPAGFSHLMNRYGSQASSTQYSNGAQMMADPFYLANDHYASNIFQGENHGFDSNHGLPGMRSLDGSDESQASSFGPSIALGDQQRADDVATAPASATADFDMAPNHGFQVAADNYEGGFEISETALSSPAHFRQYDNDAGDGNIENNRWSNDDFQQQY